MKAIEEQADKAGIKDLAAAMMKFKAHTLRGKGDLGPDEWKVRAKSRIRDLSHVVNVLSPRRRTMSSSSCGQRHSRA